MRKLGTRPRSFFSGNICFQFLVQCLCSVEASREGYGVVRCEGLGDTWVKYGHCMGKDRRTEVGGRGQRKTIVDRRYNTGQGDCIE